MPGPVASAAALAASGFRQYSLDASWQPAFPQGTNSYSAVDVANGRVYVGQRSVDFVDPVLVFDLDGRFVHSFGAGDVGKGEHHEETEFGVHGVNLHVQRGKGARSDDTVWVTDFMNHSVVAFNTEGRLLGHTGGVASADDDKFDAPSDIAFRGSSCFFVDGDGGLNMRVSRWALADGLLAKPEWNNPQERPENRSVQEFDHPHSIAWHESSEKLIVCDRDHYRIVLMDPESGAITGNVTCDLDLGPDSSMGRPFGVRTYQKDGEDLVLIAVAGNEGVETQHQFFHVLDGRNLAEGQCQVLQTVAVDPDMCHTPHLLGLDEDSGDVYIACNQSPNSNVIRFTRGNTVLV